MWVFQLVIIVIYSAILYFGIRSFMYFRRIMKKIEKIERTITFHENEVPSLPGEFKQK